MEREGVMMDKWTRDMIALIARTTLRIERHILRIGLEKMSDSQVLEHNDDCIRLRGLMEEK